MKKLLYITILLCMFWSSIIPLYGEVKFQESDIQKYGLQFDRVEVEIPGVERTYHFVWISDLHVISGDLSEVASGSRKRMIERRDEVFKNPVSGLTSAALWEKLPEMLNNSGADAVFFGGDIADSGSVSNLLLLKDGFSRLTVPFIYMREDHDFTPWRLKNKDMSRQQDVSRAIDGHPALHFIEYKDLIVIAPDNSVRSIKPEVFAQFEKIYAKGKPVILLMHVPIFPPDENNRQWMTVQHSNWLGSKKPYGKMNDFLKLATTPDGLIKAVFCGHNHRRWDGMLVPGVRQHIFASAADGTIGIITIKPRK